MNTEEVMKELESLGNEQTVKTFLKHGARRPFFGVRIGDLKKVLKKTGKDHGLALELYRTGNSDAMYLAGLMADPARMTEAVLEEWVSGAYWYMLSEYTVANAAAESPAGLALARKWIRSEEEQRAAAGWSTWCGLMALGHPALEAAELESLLREIQQVIHQVPDRVRYCMNAFVISLGSYYPEFTEKAMAAAVKIGKVRVDMGDTACKVPDAASYILKIRDRGKIGVHRKTVRC